MSKAAKMTFLGSCVFASQGLERASMYQGVIRDQERKVQREKNAREYDETRALHAELIKDQPNVRDIDSKSTT
ncbi:hypothetical protein BX661DRAFT_199935 [Kickxella alabastrina]|uniref:uncharacterized protein n=1 Tax=Kickxella alabastrina TaxID=61397 RepID=UPI00221E7B7F|nr:uncharacterized protein BX661DRAFT_199935 [Kickxella alabastrina]KAI7823968.1 hypothetical protein BX661DRAFT_199935 [Kickxella alabastrina]